MGCNSMKSWNTGITVNVKPRKCLKYVCSFFLFVFCHFNFQVLSKATFSPCPWSVLARSKFTKARIPPEVRVVHLFAVRNIICTCITLRFKTKEKQSHFIPCDFRLVSHCLYIMSDSQNNASLSVVSWVYKVLLQWCNLLFHESSWWLESILLCSPLSHATSLMVAAFCRKS